MSERIVIESPKAKAVFVFQSESFKRADDLKKLRCDIIEQIECGVVLLPGDVKLVGCFDAAVVQRRAHD